MTPPTNQKPKMVERTLPIPEKHIPKLGHAIASASAAVAAANEAERVLHEKQGEARRALNAQAHVLELVYEIVGAPQNAEPDLQAGVLRWQEPAGTEQAAVPPVAPPAPPSSIRVGE